MSFRRTAASLFALVLICFAVGCGGGSSPSTGTGGGGTTTNGSPVADLDFTTMSFGAVTIGQTVSQNVTLSNSGTATLNISSVVLADTTNFSMTSACGSTLAAGAKCQIAVTFKPATAATFDTTIVLTDNSSKGSTQTIAASGSGANAVVGTAVLSPTTVTFADTAAGATSLPSSVTLSNTGTGSLTLSSIALSGTNPAAFSSANTCGSTLASGASCTISVTFAPTAASTSYSATLTVTDNSGGASGATQSVLLNGKGAAASGAVVTLAPSALAFGSVNLGSSSTAQTLTLTNTSSATTVSSLSVAVTGGATATAFQQTNTCGSTLAPLASCTVSVTFSPTIAGSFLAYLTVTDNASNSPQEATLTGSGVTAALSLSTSAMSFVTTKVGNKATLTSTLSNGGGATANLSSIAYSGDSAFISSNNCGPTLAAGSSCTISVVFTPPSTSTYTGKVTVTSSNATPSPLTLSVTGTGTNSAVTYNLYELPDPGAGQPGAGLVSALYSQVDNAQSTIEITMYAFNDATLLQKVVNACGRGVKVRAVLDQNNEKSQNATTYSTLNSTTNCSAVWANSAFQVTHEKSFVFDSTTLALLSLNVQTQYYATTRDFAMIFNDPADVKAVQDTFNMDYAAGTTAAGVVGASDYTYQPAAGTDLIWSPTTAKQKMQDVINGATTTLLIENEELTNTASYITDAIVAACKRGVTVKVVIENQYSNYSTQIQALKTGGCAPRVYTSPTGFYVHAKVVVADYGLSTQQTYMGSINYSNPSMTQNRELGMNIADPASVQILYNTLLADWNAATIF